MELSDGQQSEIADYLATLAAGALVRRPPTARWIPNCWPISRNGGDVVKVNETVVFTTAAYEDMAGRIVEHLNANGSVTVADARTIFGTSRKYVLPPAGIPGPAGASPAASATNACCGSRRVPADSRSKMALDFGQTARQMMSANGRTVLHGQVAPAAGSPTPWTVASAVTPDDAAQRTASAGQSPLHRGAHRSRGSAR